MTNWPTKKLGELVDFLDNQRKPINDEDRQKRIGHYPYYGANGQVGWINDFIFDEDLVLLAEDGGYFGSKDKPIAYRISGKTWVNNHAHVLRVRRNIAEIGFVHYRLMFYDINPYITGSTRTKLNKSAAEKIKIPLPPLNIQKQIVERLDKIAEAQKLNDGLIQKTDELFQSLLHQELHPVRYSEQSNGVNPAGKDWGVKELGDVTLLVRGPFGGSLRKDIFVESGDCIYEQGNVIDGDLENFRYFVTPEKFRQMKRFEVLAGDILMSCSGTIGKFVIIPRNFKKGIINQALLKITPNQKVIGEFLKFTLENYFSLNKSHIKGIAIKNIAAVKELRKVKIPLPPLETQKQIVAKLSAVQEYKTQLLAQKSKLKELFDSALAKSFNE